MSAPPPPPPPPIPARPAAPAATTTASGEVLEEENTGYKVSAKVGLDQLLADKADEDEHMKKYKASLLGAGADPNAKKAKYPDNPKLVILESACLLPENEDGSRDANMPQSIPIPLHDPEWKSKKYILKEGCVTRMKLTFVVQHDIVSGLRFFNIVKRMKLTVDKDTHMIGSYGPSDKVLEVTLPPVSLPSGMLARGSYEVKSVLIDDDKVEHVVFEHAFDLKKDWK